MAQKFITLTGDCAFTRVPKRRQGLWQNICDAGELNLNSLHGSIFKESCCVSRKAFTVYLKYFIKLYRYYLGYFISRIPFNSQKQFRQDFWHV